MASARRDRKLPSKVTQPKTYRLSLKAILSFPARLCNPPPAVGKVRSCGVTPLVKVRLEDVLNREHLPPLGLKDFEEWLLFVEMSPENLYFILWLREYKLRYNQWQSQTTFQNKSAPPDFPTNPSTQYSSQLGMFYARAKQTFFTPGSEYELNLTSSLLSPFHNNKSSLPPHPPPELFREVEIETTRTLEDSLRRFVHAQLNNVGNMRVMCGIIAGIFVCVTAGLAPLIWSFAAGTSRAMRFSALPGLWLGFTILLASINGICLGVYLFGDLRQLRKFELARPPISKPTPLPASFRRIEFGAGTQSSAMQRSLSVSRTVESQKSDGASIATASTDDNIYISRAYYYDADGADAMDTVDIWGPVYAPTTDPLAMPAYRSSNDLPGLSQERISFTSTASFIHPFESGLDSDDDLNAHLESNTLSPSKLQHLAAFDFDALPRHPYPKSNHRGPRRTAVPFTPDPSIFPSPLARAATNVDDPIPTSLPETSSSLKGFFARKMRERQEQKCSFDRWRLQVGYLESENSNPGRYSGSSPAGHPLPPHFSSPYWQQRGAKSTLSAGGSASDGETTLAGTPSEKNIWARFRKVASVPAFAVPLTRVLNPVIVRAQWEIVIRSAVCALLAAWILLGILFAVPRV